MKNFLAISLLILSAGFFTARAAIIDNFGRISINLRQDQSHYAVEPKALRASSPTFTSAIVLFSEGSSPEDLEQLGIEIIYRRADMALVFIPNDVLESVGNSPSVKRCALSRPASATLDKAIAVSHADRVIAGEGLPRGFSGKGVTVGFSDTGFDPGHVAFGDRVKALCHVVDTLGKIERALTPAEIADWTTDTYDMSHATHVAGILAGYDPSVPFSGIAREAEIVGCTSQLYDVGILIGVEEVIAHAKNAGQPAVVNLSLGSKTGPHDGSDLFCRYLDLCAEEAAILLAAGNDGETRCHAAKTLTDTDSVISVMFESYIWDHHQVLAGYVDAWSSSSSPMRVRLRAWDRYTNQIVWTGDWFEPSENTVHYNADEDTSGIQNYFQGYVAEASEMSPLNNRYNITMALNLLSQALYPGQQWSRYSLVVDYSGAPGDRIDVCVEGQLGFFETASVYPWVTGGDADLSVSSLACGFNTVCVGSATTRDNAVNLWGKPLSWQSFVTEGTVSNFTSYGTTADGRSLPHFCAPGAYIVSAYSRHYLEHNPTAMNNAVGKSDLKPENYYCAECGTSMATPHSAGIFALWLEADPTLSGRQLRELAMQTARYEGVDAMNPRSGAGMIDAAAGMVKILSTQGLDDVAEQFVEARREDGRLRISESMAGEMQAEVYNLSGSLIYSGHAQGAPLPSGPAVVRLRAPGFSVVKKL